MTAALICACFSACLCIFFPHQIFGIFTNDEAVIELGATFLRIFILHFFASSVTGSFQAMVTGCGFVELGFLLGLLDGLICKIGFSVLFMSCLLYTSVIDTGFGIGDFKGLVRKLVGDKPLIVVNTHSHYDHAYGNCQFERCYCSEAEVEMCIRDSPSTTLTLSLTSLLAALTASVLSDLLSTSTSLTV